MGVEKELNIDIVLEDGIYLRNAQLGATDKIIRISKSSLLQNDADYFDSILVEFAIVKRMMRKYPSAEPPKIVYDYLKDVAKSNLVEPIYNDLIERVEKL
jgi:hypothetical protein